MLKYHFPSVLLQKEPMKKFENLLDKGILELKKGKTKAEKAEKIFDGIIF
jgi:hypothetical protein